MLENNTENIVPNPPSVALPPVPQSTTQQVPISFSSLPRAPPRKHRKKKRKTPEPETRVVSNSQAQAPAETLATNETAVVMKSTAAYVQLGSALNKTATQRLYDKIGASTSASNSLPVRSFPLPFFSHKKGPLRNIGRGYGRFGMGISRKCLFGFAHKTIRYRAVQMEVYSKRLAISKQSSLRGGRF